MLLEFAFAVFVGVCACVLVSDQSVSSFLQQRAAGGVHVLVQRTLWLCRIVGNNTGKKQAYNMTDIVIYIHSPEDR